MDYRARVDILPLNSYHVGYGQDSIMTNSPNSLDVISPHFQSLLELKFVILTTRGITNAKQSFKGRLKYRS